MFWVRCFNISRNSYKRFILPVILRTCSSVPLSLHRLVFVLTLFDVLAFVSHLFTGVPLRDHGLDKAYLITSERRMYWLSLYFNFKCIEEIFPHWKRRFIIGKTLTLQKIGYPAYNNSNAKYLYSAFVSKNSKIALLYRHLKCA